MQFLLLLSVFVIATCGLVYELISGTLASYLLGDSVTQFSTVIGVYLFSMGIGSYLSRHINRNIAGVFIKVELIIGVVGGCSSALLFLLFVADCLYIIINILCTIVHRTLANKEFSEERIRACVFRDLQLSAGPVTSFLEHRTVKLAGFEPR